MHFYQKKNHKSMGIKMAVCIAIFVSDKINES